MVSPRPAAGWRPSASEAGLYLLSASGALAFIAAGSRFAIDEVRCANWPGAGAGWISAGLFVLALAAMGLAWLGLIRDARKTVPGRGIWARTVLVALMVHAIVLAAPPFLSDDSLAYGAIGALTALHGAGLYAPLGALPDADPYRQLIAQYPAWLAHPSTYGPLANLVDALVVRLAGTDVRLALKLFQLVAALAIFFTAWLASRAAAAWAGGDPARGDPSRLQLVAFRLVAFSPLALIEATSNAHNDALLALLIAGFALATVRQRRLAGWLTLVLGLLVKLSFVLPLGFEAVRHGVRLVLDRSRRPLLVLLAAAGLSGIALIILISPLMAETASTVVRLVAPPDGGVPFCTRSLECAPRWLLHFVLDWPTGAWLVGLVFRAGGIALILTMAWRSRDKADALPALAAFILFYYLFFHAYMQAWYLLPLLPLILLLSPALEAVALVFVLSSLTQYGFDFAWACVKTMPWVAVREIGALVVAVAPPVLVLLVVWRRRRRG